MGNVFLVAQLGIVVDRAIDWPEVVGNAVHEGADSVQMGRPWRRQCRSGSQQDIPMVRIGV